MKRVGNLMAKIAEMSNLELAYYKARKGKWHKKEVFTYSKAVSDNLKKLQTDLETGEVSVGNYHYFKIYDPKERQICAAAFEERVLHHALMNVCHDTFETYQIADSYATRIDKGTFRAVERAAFFQKKYGYYLKLDVRKYFDSIDHDVLKNLLCRRFKDFDLLKILFKIIDTYETAPQKGVPIGNLTSQYFANHYLAVVDRFIKQDLQIKAYVRYMDDFIVWHNDLKVLQDIQQKIATFLSEQLALTLKTNYINKATHGLPFLGFRLFPNKILLNQRSKERFKGKISILQKAFENVAISEGCLQQRTIALFAFIKKAYTKQYRQKVIKEIGICS
jgi:retron-type reverse transcriptase